MNNETDKNLEHPEVTDLPVNADARPITVDEGSKQLLGKFANTEQLAKAYESLQAEFTRKCQLLSELEKEKNVTDKKEGNAGAADKNKAQQVLTATETRLDNTESDKSKIIEEYLMSVARRQVAPAVITTCNDFAFVKTHEPKSINDIGKVVKDFFETRTTK